MNREYIYEVEGLKKYFPIKTKKLFEKVKKFNRAVDGVDLRIKYNEIFGIVGESGCGKTTLARTMLKLMEPTEGKLIFDGQDITALTAKKMRPYRRNIQIIFQDPYASLNPRMTISKIIAEPMDTMKTYSNERERLGRIIELMEDCGINKAFLNRYPHELSGGQRQRIGIARALSVAPKLIVCDEPVSALDVSIQSQIINLLTELQHKHDLTLVFVSHDLGVVKYITNRVAVMYAGRIIEMTETSKLFASPMHPYTQDLLSAIPEIGKTKFSDTNGIIEENVPSRDTAFSGCSFYAHCPLATGRCNYESPQLKELAPGHYAACFNIEKRRYYQ